MTPPAPRKPPQAGEAVTLTVTRSATVLGEDSKPALEITATGERCQVVLLPKNGQRRAPVSLASLKVALARLEGRA